MRIEGKARNKIVPAQNLILTKPEPRPLPSETSTHSLSISSFDVRTSSFVLPAPRLQFRASTALRALSGWQSCFRFVPPQPTHKSFVRMIRSGKTTTVRTSLQLGSSPSQTITTFSRTPSLSPGDKTRQRAVNINTLGEVPDSSWFTNRHGKKPLSLEELVRGPDQGGPLFRGNSQVIQNKQSGITPGFRVKDTTGTIYQMEFDPVTNPEMATSAEVICTKIFHAIGYYVAEVYIVTFSRNEIELAKNAQYEDLAGKTRPLTTKDIDQILEKAHVGPDGRYRTIASKFLPGKPVGTYRYYGTRPDDPNDIFPHEHRRELRGLRVFSAWLNHDDSRSINSFDSLISENGRQYIRHYLFDFGSTLGSGTVFAQKPRAGNEYLWEPGPTFKSLFSLGLWVRPWIRVDYPDYPSIGNFEADFFQPEKWKPEYPNPAFDNMTDEDAFWAAKIVMAFSDDQAAGHRQDRAAQRSSSRSLSYGNNHQAPRQSREILAEPSESTGPVPRGGKHSCVR